MKKKSGLKRVVPIMTVAELEALNTKALLARLQRLRYCEESQQYSDLSDGEVASVDDQILFKSDPAWSTAYKDLKQVLDHREHVGK